jgi:hypothetical protein
MRTAVDSSVLLDVLGADPRFGARSREALRTAYDAGALVACEVVWAEVRAHFAGGDEFQRALGRSGFASIRSRLTLPLRPDGSGGRAGAPGRTGAAGSSPTSWSVLTPRFKPKRS